MQLQDRHFVNCYGYGPTTLVFGHGFGCDQSMWRLMVPLFQHRYRIVLYDLLGSGRSDLSAYDPERYSTLHEHARDLLAIIDAYSSGPVIFIGHSVSSMIGMLASIDAPSRFAGLVMVAPSPCYINDGQYVGGFNREDIDGLLELMHANFAKWAAQMAPVIMGAPDRPDLQRELQTAFCHNDPHIARHFGRVTFLSDLREQVPLVTVPVLILQSTDDMIAPREVGDYLHAHLPQSELVLIDNVGHCPHMSAPQPSVGSIERFLAGLRS